MNHFDIGNNFDRDITGFVWPSLNVEIVKKYTSKLEQRRFGDYQILIEGQKRNVDIKAEKDMPPNFPIELLQDWQSSDIGWYYTLSGCDEIWYGRYTEDELEVYRVSLLRLRYSSNSWPVKLSNKAYGQTIFIIAPLRELIDGKICVKVWPIE